MAVTCVADDDGDELFRGDAEVEFSDPLQVVELQFIFPNARFPRAANIASNCRPSGKSSAIASSSSVTSVHSPNGQAGASSTPEDTLPTTTELR